MSVWSMFVKILLGLQLWIQSKFLHFLSFIPLSFWFRNYWWLIFKKRPFQFWWEILNSGLSYRIATVCNVKDLVTDGLTNSKSSRILNFHESFLDKLYSFQTTSILKINHKLFVKTNFLTRSTSGPPHILSFL